MKKGLEERHPAEQRSIPLRKRAGEPPTGLEVLGGLAVLSALIAVDLGILFWMPGFDDPATRVAAHEAGFRAVGAIAFFGVAVPLLLTRRRHAFEAMAFRSTPLARYVLWIPAAVLLPYALSQTVLIATRLAGYEIPPIADPSMSDSLEFLGVIPTFLINVIVAAPAVAIAYFGVILPWMRRRLPLTACAVLLAAFDGAWVGFEGNIAGTMFWASATMLQVFAWGRSGSLWVPIAMNVAAAAIEVAIAWAELTPT